MSLYIIEIYSFSLRLLALKVWLHPWICEKTFCVHKWKKHFGSNYLIVGDTSTGRSLFPIPTLEWGSPSQCLRWRKVNLLISSLTYEDTVILLNVFFSPSPLSPVSTQTELSQKLTLCSKLCFAIGGAPKEVAASATAFFLQIYLLDIAQVMCLRPHRMKKNVCGFYIWMNEMCLFFNPSLSLFISAD